MNDFERFCRIIGLRPRHIVPDGRWHRCGTDEHPKKRNGAYKLSLDGRIGWAQDWSTMSEPAMWRVGKDNDRDDFDVTAFRRSQAEAKKQSLEAVHAARKFYEGAKPLRGGHPYLDAHGLDMRGCEGLKVDKDGWLVVPAFRGTAKGTAMGTSMMSLQRISPDGQKRFWPGAPIGGTAYRVERPRATVNVLCEGLATGLACYAALPSCRVIVAWSAGNLSQIENVPPGFLVIAADNDHGTEERIGKNPGIEAANKAAQELGCGVAFPTGIIGTDWCDLRQERFQDRLGKAGEYETRARIQQAVDAEIRAALMKSAAYRGAA